MTRDEVRLLEILSAVDHAASIRARGRSAFDADPLLQRAAKNIVSEVGEAAKQLSDVTTAAIGGVNRKAAKGMRDVTVHRYWAVVPDVLWSTLGEDLPPVGEAIRAHLGQKG